MSLCVGIELFGAELAARLLDQLAIFGSPKPAPDHGPVSLQMELQAIHFGSVTKGLRKRGRRELLRTRRHVKSILVHLINFFLLAIMLKKRILLGLRAHLQRIPAKLPMGRLAHA